MFEFPSKDRLPRRAILLMPLSLMALTAAVYRRPRSLPDPNTTGNGPLVPLALFDDKGRLKQARYVRKWIRTPDDWRRDLTSTEWAITRKGATEPPFDNRYWHVYAPGLYRCVCCGNALFRSEDKFDSGTGWPSFTRPCAPVNIYTRPDTSSPAIRTEVLCTRCDAHLGHVFEDGPAPAELRYCLNSGALRLVRYSAPCDRFSGREIHRAGFTNQQETGERQYR